MEYILTKGENIYSGHMKSYFIIKFFLFEGTLWGNVGQKRD